MTDIVIGIGESAASNKAEDQMKTYALGSCVAIVILDPKSRTGGMAHIALPDSEIDQKKRENLPSYFADSGVPDLLSKMKAQGMGDLSKIIVKLIGGASVLNNDDHFQIGKRNVTALKKIFWDLNIPVAAEDVGKDYSRTVRMEMKTGKVFISSPDRKEWRV